LKCYERTYCFNYNLRSYTKMKTTEIVLHVGRSQNEEKQIEVRAVGILKSILVILLLSAITVLFCIAVGFPYQRLYDNQQDTAVINRETMINKYKYLDRNENNNRIEYNEIHNEN